MKAIRELIRLIVENWTLKLAAVFLALILWLVVRGDPGAERIVSVPLDISVPRTMEIVSDRPSVVDVTLRGASGSMWLVQQMSCIVDLRTAAEGEHIVSLTPDNMRFPNAAGLEIIAIRPPRFMVDLEQTISKEVPVLATTRGEPAPGYDVYSKAAEPSKVTISGPRSRIENITEVATEVVALSDRRETVRIYANLNIKDPMVHSSPVGPIAVRIEIGLHRRPVVVNGVVVTVDSEFTVEPRWVSVSLLVPANLTRKWTKSDLSAVAPAEGLDPSLASARIRPEVKLVGDLDPAIVIREVQPAEVTVRRKVNGSSVRH